MNQELDYAEMLEIPVSTVSVVKKKSFFKKRVKKEQPAPDDLKDLVVDSVNERVGAYVYAEDLTEPVEQPKTRKFFKSGDVGGRVILSELVAVCVLALAIFLTNVFMPTSAINTFIGSLANRTKPEAEPTYSEIKLSSVVSELSDADVEISDNGVITFTAKSCVYPVCAGKIASVTQNDGLYTVQIAHTSTFSSVITGLTNVYSAPNTSVEANIPFAYSDGEHAVNISMYDGETLLNCYTLSGEVPVWNS